ncbi:NAD(P)-dependent dehydrogenase, short-chain alcohol dehydrogenase family [Sporobacter termitidis DSM 10068]|uniref:NAD(P)-dependent dehydrogenase, short-chain alcohol dehydrogenase family n=1 Tax=Sporobacter termitidis DSM 10068 TaxID=1123282 RepID=A0A1M5YRJ4_9FIRM|nr:SDR family oxidoreductase [Sporobacter termitidis]SHI14581.1 NAD(P)-dependent dehydrogenase, short-chain alcohol dehydrogenase family [Sporobacter termitidis DSM 10068]
MLKLPFEVDLRGKVAVVTGGGGVLCSMFAEALAQSGAKVAVLNRTYEKARVVAEQIAAQGGAAKAYKVDVTDKAAILGVHDTVLSELGKCDILINGAGGNDPRATTAKEYYAPGDLNADIVSFFDLDTESVRAVFDLNFIGTLIPTQVFAADMLGRGGCTIINISSMNAFTPLTKIPAYSAAKAGISNFTQWLAVHFSRVGIRVNAIAPGFFSTAQNASLLFNQDGTPTARTHKILSATPLGRFGERDELIGTLLYLASPEASGFVTGVVIPVDGGFSAYGGV